MSLSGCFGTNVSQEADIRLATTTSMRDSGLLDVLIEEFTALHDHTVEYVAVGTGAALRLGEQGDVDALIVHAPDREQEFLDEGYGLNRTSFAWNSFVFLAPSTETTSIAEAFLEVVNRSSCFVSRGDFSGTHEKEQAIWRALNETHAIEVVEDQNGLHPIGEWYHSIGQGMGATINMADEKRCSTLSDRGTALKFQSQIDLQRYEYNDSVLFNPYSFIPVTGMANEGTQQFLHYLQNEGQITTEAFSIDGEKPFFVYDQP